MYAPKKNLHLPTTYPISAEKVQKNNNFELCILNIKFYVYLCTLFRRKERKGSVLGDNRC